MLLLVRLFHALSWATVQPCLSAILPNTSPLFTIYVVAFAGADEVLAAVVDDDDDDVEKVERWCLYLKDVPIALDSVEWDVAYDVFG